VAAVADVSIIIVQGPNEGREFEVSGAIVIGRDTSAGLVIDDPEASRRHASLSLDGSDLRVEDLGSTNGTFVNGARISEPQALSQGDKLRIGTTVFDVQIAAEDEAQATRVGTALPDLDDLQVTAPRQVPDFAKEEPPAAPAAPEPPAPEPVAPEPIQPTAAGIPQPPAPTNAPPPSSGPPGGIVGPPGGGPEGGPPPPPGGAPPPPSAPPPTATPPPPSAPPPAYAPPPAGPPAPYVGGGVPAVAYPVSYEADYPEAGIARWRCFFQGVMAYPHFLVLLFVGLGALVAFLVAWFAILFTGRYPRGLFNYITGTLRWSNRVNGFAMLMTEKYPPFSLDEAPYPIRTRFEYPEAGIARWRPLAHYFMALPHLLILEFLAFGALFALIFAWFSILFTRRYPPGVFNYIAGVNRWSTRVQGFIFLTTEQYPPFSLD
jgi:pSer/pThr/pTyr-binding forkhead associated (FHA) protein